MIREDVADRATKVADQFGCALLVRFADDSYEVVDPTTIKIAMARADMGACTDRGHPLFTAGPGASCSRCGLA